MKSITLRDIGALPGDEKRSLETLLQHPVGRGQQVFILVFTPGKEPDARQRKRAQAGLEQTWSQVQAHMRKKNITAKKFDAAVERTMKDVRRRS